MCGSMICPHLTGVHLGRQDTLFEPFQSLMDEQCVKVELQRGRWRVDVESS